MPTAGDHRSLAGVAPEGGAEITAHAAIGVEAGVAPPENLYHLLELPVLEV